MGEEVDDKMAFGRKEDLCAIRGELDIREKIYILTTPTAGAFFTTYEHTKSLFTRLNTNTRNEAILPIAFVHASASSLAELVSCAILTPAEVIKQNAQMVSSTSQSQNATLQTLGKSPLATIHPPLSPTPIHHTTPPHPSSTLQTNIPPSPSSEIPIKPPRPLARLHRPRRPQPPFYRDAVPHV